MAASTHNRQVITQGPAVGKSGGVMILLHGRGSTAADILTLSRHLDVGNLTLLAPQATNNTWYPQSFLAPLAQNEPWLGSAVGLVHDLVREAEDKGVATENIYIAGFSQGACLALESATRDAKRYGGIFAFTGGLIGDHIYRDHYEGRFEGTPVYIGTSDVDAHVPLSRVYATENVLQERGAIVNLQVFPGMGHTILPDEIDAVNKILNQSTVKSAS